MKVPEDAYYSRIPNQLFYSTVENRKSIYQIVKDFKVLLVLDYLYYRTDRRDKIKFTLEDMIKSCGYTPDRHKGRANDQFKDVLSILKSNDYIQSDFDFSIIKPTELVCCELSIDLKTCYMMLYEKEKEAILGIDNTYKVDNVQLLFYYCYLKCRIYKRKDGDDLAKDGGRAEVAYPTYKTINGDIGLTDETIKKYNDLLIELDLIRIDNPGLWYYSDDKNKLNKESPNFYTLFDGNEEVAKYQLKEAIKYYKLLDINSNKVFLNSPDYKNNDRSLNGKLGAIIKKERNGTATAEDLLLKNQILESKNADVEEYKFLALLQANPEKILSEIYYDMHKTAFADTISDLEYKFGLIDDEANLLINRDYYVWAMTNYKKYDEQYMINCVFKYKRDNNQFEVDPDTGEVINFRINENADNSKEVRLPFNGFYSDITA